MVLLRSSSSLVVHVVFLSSGTSAATRMMPYRAPCELAPLGSAALSSLKCAAVTWSISTSRPEQDILDAYIRGEIEAQDLVEIYKRRQQHGALEDEESEPPADLRRYAL